MDFWTDKIKIKFCPQPWMALRAILAVNNSQKSQIFRLASLATEFHYFICDVTIYFWTKVFLANFSKKKKQNIRFWDASQSRFRGNKIPKKRNFPARFARQHIFAIARLKIAKKDYLKWPFEKNTANQNESLLRPCSQYRTTWCHWSKKLKFSFGLASLATKVTLYALLFGYFTAF